MISIQLQQIKGAALNWLLDCYGWLQKKSSYLDWNG